MNAAKRKKRRKRNLGILWVILAFALATTWFFRYDIQKLLNRPSEGAQHLAWYQSKLKQYKNYGIDVSEYQEDIDWEKLANETDIQFVFIRATAGKNKKDTKFDYNWEEAHKHGFVCGAYHYYRPNENSLDQVSNFVEHVRLKKGDLPPVVDIERYSSIQSVSSLLTGVLKFLMVCERFYGVTPIIYTYKSFYENQIRNDSRFDKYTVWIAWYNVEGNPSDINENWMFWQFTDRGIVSGIETPVDINVFCCDKKELQKLKIKENKKAKAE